MDCANRRISTFTWSNGDPLAEVPWVAQWAGIGGAPGGPNNYILQAGVVEVSANTTKYRFFTENYPAQSAVLHGPSIAAGDQAYVTVSTTLSNGQYLTSYFVENETTGTYSAYDVNTSDVSEWSAEFETEANPGFGVPQFTSVAFSGCSVYYGPNGGPFGDETYTEQVDESYDSSTGQYIPLMTPTAVDSTNAGFTVNFKNP